MDFDTLSNGIQAIVARNIVLNYSRRTISLTLIPNYGFNQEFAGKNFQLIFEDCIFFKADNTSLMAKGEQIEFIAWGKNKNNNLFQELLKRQWNRDMTRIKK